MRPACKSLNTMYQSGPCRRSMLLIAPFTSPAAAGAPTGKRSGGGHVAGGAGKAGGKIIAGRRSARDHRLRRNVGLRRVREKKRARRGKPGDQGTKRPQAMSPIFSVQFDPRRRGAEARGTEFFGRMLPIHGIRKDEGKGIADLPVIHYAAMLRPHSS